MSPALFSHIILKNFCLFKSVFVRKVFCTKLKIKESKTATLQIRFIVSFSYTDFYFCFVRLISLRVDTGVDDQHDGKDIDFVRVRIDADLISVAESEPFL